MRIATYNINGMNARQDYLRHFLVDNQPDVIGLQELKMTDDRFPTDVFEELGYHAVTHGQKSWNGVAILSREPAEVIAEGLPGQADQGARLLAARVGGVSVVTVYCPNGKDVTHPDYHRKLAWFDSLRDFVGATFTPDDAVVLCGDFNIVPAAIDSWSEEYWDGRIFHTEAERARLGALLDWGLVDSWRVLNPDDPGFSWWDYRRGAFHKHQGLRIDLLLATAPVMERAQAAALERRWRKKVEGLTASDHAPVWLDLR